MSEKTNGLRKGCLHTANVTIEHKNLRLKSENEYIRKIMKLNKDNIKKQFI